MKKLRIALIAMVIALAAVGVAACTGEKKPAGEHTVTFQIAGGGSIEPQTVKDGETAVKPADPERIGWTFDGWYLGDAEYTFTEKVTQDITLTARYTSVLGGEGTAASPFTIDTAEELELMSEYISLGASEFVSANYIQTADIVSALGEKNNHASISEFAGIYDGNGMSLSISDTLFDTLSGTVKNLKLCGEIEVVSSDAELSGIPAGVLANTADGALISGLTVSGNIKSERAVTGGIVGELKSGRMEYVNSSVNVKGLIAGGIAGKSGGSVINCVSTGEVAASGTNAGGIAGILAANGLIQNCGFGGAVTSGENAGGIAGNKEANSAIFRAFVFGNRIIAGKNAGGIAGKVDASFYAYEDVVNCAVGSDVAVSSQSAATVTKGESVVPFFTSLGLPQTVWNLDGETPALKAEIENAPAEVKLTVGGEEISVPYGSHTQGELFTDSEPSLHFSTLIELDASHILNKAEPVHIGYAGAFTSGSAEIEFNSNGAVFSAAQNAEPKNLIYKKIYFRKDTFTYTPDFSNPSQNYDVEYDAPVSIYSDGENVYAFVVTKEQIQSGYVAFLESYVQTSEGWEHSDSWFPKADNFKGAYSYTTNFSLVSVMKHFVIIDGEYVVENGEGYYLTRYMPVYLSHDGELLDEGKVIAGRGQTVMFLGDNEHNAPKTALYFDVNYEGYVDFIYYNEKGELVSSTGAPVGNATSHFLDGSWFDGVNKYTFNTENGTVEITGANGNKNVSFTIDGNTVSFAADGKNYNLVLAPTEFGAYKLVSADSGEEFTVATYISDAFNGTWITENGDVLTVASEPAANVTFNGAAVQAHEAVFNGVQAVHFEVESKEYYLVAYRDEGVTLLYSGNTSVSAFSGQMLEERFAGDFVSVAGGSKITLSITDELSVTFKEGAEAAQTVKAKPTVIVGEGENEYGIEFELGAESFTALRKNDAIVLTSENKTLAFTTVEFFNRFIVEYTNGSEMLKITEDGTFARYARGGAAADYTELTAQYREERAAYGGENRGFVLSHKDGDDTFFFYADSDAQNVRYFRARPDSKTGKEVVQQANNFVPESELESVFGSVYGRTYSGNPDTLTFAADGTLTRVYTASIGGEQTEKLLWYPILNYNKNTQTSRLSAYTYESGDNGIGFTTLIEFTTTGMKWGLNSYFTPEVQAVFDPFMALVYKNTENTMLEVLSDGIKLTFLKRTEKENNGTVTVTYSQTTSSYSFDTFDIENGIITITMTESGMGIDEPRSANMVLSKNGAASVATLTVADGAAQEFTGEAMLNYEELAGNYTNNGTTYSFKVSSSWLGTTISLEYVEGTATRKYNYTTSNGVVIMTNGKQALPMRNNSYAYKYVWKEGSSLMISDSFDASEAIAAEDTAIAGMPSIDELKEMLDGKEFTAADGSVVSFESGSGIMGAWFQIVDGEIELLLDSYSREVGVYTLMFGDAWTDSRCVLVYLNEAGITKLMVGETVETATKEYSPAVLFPSVDEMKNMLLNTGYKAADGTTAMFYMDSTWLGDYYTFSLDGVTYDYKSGSFADGVYTFEFAYSSMRSATVIVTYSASGIEKITVDGKDYLPIALPTIDELKNMLDGKTFTDEYDETQTVLFEIRSNLFGEDFYIQLNGDENEEYIYDKKGTQDGTEYTLVFSFRTSKTVVVTLYPDGTVQKITIGENEYVPAE